MYDRFDIFRDEMGAEIVDNFLAKFGLGPDYKPAPITTQVCPSCLEDGAYLREFGQSAMVDKTSWRYIVQIVSLQKKDRI